MLRELSTVYLLHFLILSCIPYIVILKFKGTNNDMLDKKLATINRQSISIESKLINLTTKIEENKRKIEASTDVNGGNKLRMIVESLEKTAEILQKRKGLLGEKALIIIRSPGVAGKCFFSLLPRFPSLSYCAVIITYLF